MSKSYLLGVDIGTYESKGVVTTTSGEVIRTEVRPHTLSIPRQGWAEHDAERDWWGDLCSIIRALIDGSGISPNDVAAIGCSSIGPDMLPVDSECRPMRPAVLYGIDTRATSEIAFLEELLGSENVFRRCGASLSTQSVGPKILWLKNNEPEVYERAHRFVGGTTFLVARLTGRYVIDHYSAASYHPLYDATAATWVDDLARPIVETERLPEILWTTDVAGTVTREAATQTGLAEGTPVITGTIDAAAEAVSVGVVKPGQMMLMYGTTLFMVEVLGRRVNDKRLWSAPYLFPGTHALMAGMSTTGALTRWFRDNFARDLVSAEQQGGVNAYSFLSAEAANVKPGAEGLITLPYFSGERTPIMDPEARGVIFGLTLAHTRAHLYRSVMESAGYGIRHHLDVLASVDAAPEMLRAVGGGTKSADWMQIVSDICGRTQEIPAVTIGAAFGDAFLAGLGAGVFSSYQQLSEWVRDITPVNPQAAATAAYRPFYDTYLELYCRNKDLMHRLNHLA